MGACGACCKILLLIWAIVGLLYSLGVVGMMAFKLNSAPTEDSSEIYPLLIQLNGTNEYSSINIQKLDKYTWYTGLGLGTLMFLALLVHVIAACKHSRCLMALGMLLLLIVVVGDIGGLVLWFRVLNNIGDNLKPSMMKSLENQYNNSVTVTDAWHYLENLTVCCGVDTVKDFEKAKYWNVSIEQAPCSRNIGYGCAEAMDIAFIKLNIVWLASLFAVKALFETLVILHTICVCRYGFSHSHHDEDSSSYHLTKR